MAVTADRGWGNVPHGVEVRSIRRVTRAPYLSLLERTRSPTRARAPRYRLAVKVFERTTCYATAYAPVFRQPRELAAATLRSTSLYTGSLDARLDAALKLVTVALGLETPISSRTVDGAVTERTMARICRARRYEDYGFLPESSEVFGYAVVIRLMTTELAKQSA